MFDRRLSHGIDPKYVHGLVFKVDFKDDSVRVKTNIANFGPDLFRPGDHRIPLRHLG